MESGNEIGVTHPTLEREPMIKGVVSFVVNVNGNIVVNDKIEKLTLLTGTAQPFRIPGH